jgi:hypothetical protein
MEHVVKADLPQAGYQDIHGQGAGRHSDFFSQGQAHSRGYLGDDYFLRIGNCSQQLVDFFDFTNCSYRAGMDTLPAHNTGAFKQLFTQSGYDHGLLAAVFHAQGMNSLNITAGSYATAAKDTFVRIPEKGRGGTVFAQPFDLQFKGIFPDTVFCRQALQFAIFVADTIQAILGMIGQDKFQDSFAGFQDPGASGFYIHSFCCRLGTGCLEQVAAGHFTDTDPAVCFDRLVGMMAEGRDIDPGFLGCLQDSRAFGN